MGARAGALKHMFVGQCISPKLPKHAGINRGSRLPLTSLFHLKAGGRFEGRFKTAYGGQGLGAVRNGRPRSPPGAPRS